MEVTGVGDCTGKMPSKPSEALYPSAVQVSTNFPCLVRPFRKKIRFGANISCSPVKSRRRYGLELPTARAAI